MRWNFGRKIQKYRNTLGIIFICHCPVVEKWRLLWGDSRGGAEAQGKRAQVTGTGKVWTSIVQKESVSLLPVIHFAIPPSASVFCLATGLQSCGCRRKGKTGSRAGQWERHLSCKFSYCRLRIYGLCQDLKNLVLYAGEDSRGEQGSERWLCGICEAS